jgi:MSHA biogenesis protein MshQ
MKLNAKGLARILLVIVVALPLLAVISGCGGKDSTEPSKSTNQLNIPTNGLLIYLQFEGNVNDASGNGNNGTLLGGAIASGALVMGDNDTDALSLPSTVMDGLHEFTFAAWLRMDSLRNASHEVISGANASFDNVLIFWYREHTDEWVVGINGGNNPFVVDNRIEDQQWHHVALTRSGSTASLYLDGAVLGSAVTVGNDTLEIDPGGLIFGQDQDVLGGGFAQDQSWAGAMDNLCIYNRALSAAEVQTVANDTH